MLLKKYKMRPIIGILAGLMLVVALACAGEDPTPTSAPTATTAPTATAAPVATTDSSGVAQPTATPVPEVVIDPGYTSASALEKHPGFNPEWGTPKTGGVYKAATCCHGRPAWGLGGSSWSQWLFQSHNSLIKLDTWLTKEDVIVDIAESWGISDDGLTYTFKLREGIKFMTEGTGWGKEAVGDIPAAPGYGEEFVCSDAKASMEWYIWPEKGFFSAGHISGVRGYFRNVEGFTCPDGPDGYTLEMTVAYPRSGTVAWLAIGYKMWQADYLAWLNEYYPKIRYSYKEEGLLTNMGTGPFIPTAYEDMAYAKMKRNPGYWREGLPFVDGIDWYIIVDNTTRYAAWITGKVHFYGHGSDGLTPPQVAMTQRNYPDFKIWQIQHYLSFAVEFNLIAPPTNDVRVRQAFNLVFDRDAWWDLKAAGELEGSRMYMILLPDSPWGFTEEEIREMPGYRQPKDDDIAEANRLLDEVFGEGIRPTDTKCISQDVAARSDNCLFATEQMRRATGWDIKMEIMGSAALSERVQNCEYRMQGSSWDRSLATDPSGRFYEKYESGRFTRDCLRPTDADEVADTDLRIAAQDIEMDPVKRKEMVRSLVKDLTYGRVAAATLGNVVNFWGTRPEVRGEHYIHVAYYGSWPQYERVWLAD